MMVMAEECRGVEQRPSARWKRGVSKGIKRRRVRPELETGNFQDASGNIHRLSQDERVDLTFFV